MTIRLEDLAPQDVRSSLFVAGLYEGEKPSAGGLGRLDASLGHRIERAILQGDFEGRLNQVLPLYGGHEQGPRHIYLVGLGPRAKSTHERVRRAFGVAGKRARSDRISDVAILPPLTGAADDDLAAMTAAAVEGVVLAMYRFGYRSRYEERYPKLETVSVIPGDDVDRDAVAAAVAKTDATVDGVYFARTLVDMPGGHLYPESYADQARALASDRVTVEVLDDDRLRELKMGAILAVGQGSAHPPRILHLTYEPENAGPDTKTFCIVGKGVTFDSGGLDLKPASGMRDMKQDMGGSAAVMGVFKAIERIKPNCRVHGFVAAVENMTGSNAYRPGDILTSYKGLTIEVDNTDAEGRLALADTLAYAVDTVKPDAMVDLATLTGACVIALGHYVTGLMSNDDAIAELLFTSGEATGERVWRLPLYCDYGEQIKSEVADIKNTGGRPAGSITAGMFLQEFVGDTPWAHLDVAGTADNGPHSYTPHKELGTGVGVRLLLDALTRWA